MWKYRACSLFKQSWIISFIFFKISQAEMAYFKKLLLSLNSHQSLLQRGCLAVFQKPQIEAALSLTPTNWQSNLLGIPKGELAAPLGRSQTEGIVNEHLFQVKNFY